MEVTNQVVSDFKKFENSTISRKIHLRLDILLPTPVSLVFSVLGTPFKFS